jgi:hypothetical protein
MNRISEKILIMRSRGNASSVNSGPAIRNFQLLMFVFCACAGLAGCASQGGILGVDCRSDIAAGVVPEPPGTKVCNYQQSQVAAASLDQNVLYRADFVGTTSELAPTALARLARQHATGRLGSETLVVEPSGDRGLDQRRLQAVGSKLAELGIANVPVELAIPAALGLSGSVAEGSLSGGRPSQGVRSGMGGFGFGAGNVLGGSF